MVKKISVFGVCFLFLFFSFSLRAMIQEELERIDKAQFLLQSIWCYTGALQKDVEKEETSPFLEKFTKNQKEFVLKSGIRINKTREKPIFQNVVFGELYTDGFFLKSLSEMLFCLKNSLESQTNESYLPFFSKVMGIILKEVEVCMSNIQFTFFKTFVRQCGKTEKFKTRYNVSLEEANGCQWITREQREGRAEIFMETSFMRCLIKDLQKKPEGDGPYSQKGIENFERFMEEAPILSDIDAHSMLAGHYLEQFSEFIPLYRILQETSLSKYSPFTEKSLSEELIEVSQKNFREVLIGRERALQPSSQLRFGGLKKIFMEEVEITCSRHMAMFKDLIDETQKEIKKKIKKAKEREKEKEKKKKLRQRTEKEQSQQVTGSLSSSSQFSEVSLEKEAVRSSIEEDVLETEEDKEGDTASEGQVDQDIEAFLFNNWWEAYQQRPQIKEGRMKEVMASVQPEKALVFKLSEKAFSFFKIMGHQAPWNPNLDFSDLQSFQSEIICQYQGYLGKQDKIMPFLLRVRKFARPTLILPNLNPKSCDSGFYLLFRLPHLPHGRGENNFYPALKHFYQTYFEVAGLSLKNVFLEN